METVEDKGGSSAPAEKVAAGGDEKEMAPRFEIKSTWWSFKGDACLKATCVPFSGKRLTDSILLTTHLSPFESFLLLINRMERRHNVVMGYLC